MVGVGIVPVVVRTGCQPRTAGNVERYCGSVADCSRRVCRNPLASCLDATTSMAAETMASPRFTSCVSHSGHVSGSLHDRFIWPSSVGTESRTSQSQCDKSATHARKLGQLDYRPGRVDGLVLCDS